MPGVFGIIFEGYSYLVQRTFRLKDVQETSLGVRKKLIMVVAGGEIALSVAVLAAPVIFPLCSHGTAACGQSFKALTGASTVVILAAVLSIISRGMEAPRMLSCITALGGALIALYPSFIIGVCDNPMMACTYGDLPVWNLCGITIVFLSIVAFFAARKEEESS